MAKYEKWLGAGLGWMITGNPLGGLLGYLAGTVTDKTNPSGVNKESVSDFEVNLLILSSYLIKLDGSISSKEVNFVHRFMTEHFGEKFAEKRKNILQHCLEKEYDLNAACEQLRMYTKHTTRIQIIQFLFDMAKSDGEITERQHFFIFKLAGFLNVNDVEFKRIKTDFEGREVFALADYYEVLKVQPGAAMEKVTAAYRQLVLKYHPDRNQHLTELEKKGLSTKLQQVKEAYEKIKAFRAK